MFSKSSIHEKLGLKFIKKYFLWNSFRTASIRFREAQARSRVTLEGSLSKEYREKLWCSSAPGNGPEESAGCINGHECGLVSFAFGGGAICAAAHSSNSHTQGSQQHMIVPKHKNKSPTICMCMQTGKLYMVDLAGSEKVSKNVAIPLSN